MTEKPVKDENSVPELRLAGKEDLKGLKEIWKLSFGDEDSFIDLFFHDRNWTDETAVLLCCGKVVSMLTMIPVSIIGEAGRIGSASMIYAVATHPDFQKRGFADRLIEFSNRLLLSKEVPVTVLVPAEEELFRYYEKRGYTEGFFVREVVLSKDDLNTLEDSPGREELHACRITSIDPALYNAVRRKQLKGCSYLDYRDAEVAFQKSLGGIYDSDLLFIDAGSTKGCAYYERISGEKVIIKELLIPDSDLVSALKSIAEFVPAKFYTVRTPAQRGASLGGRVRSFGMIKINGAAAERYELNPAGSKDYYLGIAYD